MTLNSAARSRSRMSRRGLDVMADVSSMTSGQVTAFPRENVLGDTQIAIVVGRTHGSRT